MELKKRYVLVNSNLMIIIKKIKALCFLVDFLTFSQNSKNDQKSTVSSKEVLKTMEKVANWQLGTWKEKAMMYPKWNWTNSAGYIGFTN